MSGYVALCRPLPGAVVTWLVTGPHTRIRTACSRQGSRSAARRHAMAGECGSNGVSARMHEPYGASVIIDQVPDSRASRNLDLPAVHLTAAEMARCQRAAQLAVPVVPHTRPCPHVLPGDARVSWCGPAQFLPAFGGIVVGKDHLPLIFGSGRGDALSSARTHAAGWGTGPQSAGGVVSAARMSGSACASAVACHSRSMAASLSGAWLLLPAASARSEASSFKSSADSGAAHGIASRRSCGKYPTACACLITPERARNASITEPGTITVMRSPLM